MDQLDRLDWLDRLDRLDWLDRLDHRAFNFSGFQLTALSCDFFVYSLDQRMHPPLRLFRNLIVMFKDSTTM